MRHIIFTFRSAGGSISSSCPSYNVTDCSHTCQEKHILLFKTHIQLLRWGLTSERTCLLFFPWRSALSLWTQLRLSPSWDHPGTRSTPALSTRPGSSRCSSRFKWGGSMSTTNPSPLCRSIIKSVATILSPSTSSAHWGRHLLQKNSPGRQGQSSKTSIPVNWLV